MCSLKKVLDSDKSIDAQDNLGLCYHVGQGVEQDYEEANSLISFSPQIASKTIFVFCSAVNVLLFLDTIMTYHNCTHVENCGKIKQLSVYCKNVTLKIIRIT